MAPKVLRKFNELDEKIQTLIQSAVQVRTVAYCPYSKFPVGASVLSNDGEIFSGCNIENSAYTVGLCAERAALAQAVSKGKRKFQAVAVIADQAHSITSPCGACRQFMSEFNPKMEIYCCRPDFSSNDIWVTNLEQLLPEQFHPNQDYTF